MIFEGHRRIGLTAIVAASLFFGAGGCGWSPGGHGRDGGTGGAAGTAGIALQVTASETHDAWKQEPSGYRDWPEGPSIIRQIP
jgi:hypothetical protein